MGVVTDAQVDKALDYSRANACRIGEALVKLEFCPQKTVSRALAKQFGLPFADLGKAEIKAQTIEA